MMTLICLTVPKRYDIERRSFNVIDGVMTEKRIGPFSSSEALLHEMEDLGLEFPPVMKTLAFFVEEDGFINTERPICWVGKRTKDVHWTLAVEAPSEPDDRPFPSNIPYTEMLLYEKKFEWPIWISQTTHLVALKGCDCPKVIDFSPEGLPLLLRQADSFLTMTISHEMVGFGRVGEVVGTIRTACSLAPLAKLLGSLVAGCYGSRGHGNSKRPSSYL